LVEIRSVTSEITRRRNNTKKEKDKKDRKKNTAVKYKPFGIAMPCGLKTIFKKSILKILSCILYL